MTNTSHRGHGGEGAKQMKPMDPGAIGSGTTEYKEVSWINDYFLKMTKWIDTSDYSGRTVNQNLVNIVNNVNRVAKWSDINISHHFNAFNGKATGAEVWYYLGDAKGRALAEKVSAAISKALGIPNRGAKATTNLYVVSNTVGTTILIEWAFVDNASDMRKWNANKVKGVNEVLKVLGYTPNTVDDYGPQGPWIAENKRVRINTRHEKIYSGFDWKLRTLTKDVFGKEYKVTGKYHHKNGFTYYSLYDDKGKWHGYINSAFVTEVAPKPSAVPSKGKWIAERGKFHVGVPTPGGTNIPVTRLPLTVNATGNGAKIADITRGQYIVYDAFMNDGKYMWIRQPRGNGKYGYMATGNIGSNGLRKDYWGKFTS